MSFLLWISGCSKQSSTNMWTVDRTLLGRSFMYTRNNRGPVTVSCGTPDITGDSEDVWPSSTTSWVRPCKKSVIQLRVEFLMPYCSNFRSRREWDTLSNASEKLRRMASNWSELSTILARSLTVSISCVSFSWNHVAGRIRCHTAQDVSRCYCSMNLLQTEVSEMGTCQLADGSAHRK